MNVRNVRDKLPKGLRASIILIARKYPLVFTLHQQLVNTFWLLVPNTLATWHKLQTGYMSLACAVQCRGRSLAR